jgi:hypothetical protein
VNISPGAAVGRNDDWLSWAIEALNRSRSEFSDVYGQRQIGAELAQMWDRLFEGCHTCAFDLVAGRRTRKLVRQRELELEIPWIET